MRKHATRWLLLSTAIAAFAGCTGQPQQMPAEAGANLAAIRAAIDSLSGAFGSAVAARDTNAVADFYAGDARLLPPNAPRVDGKAGAREVWAGFLRMPGLDLSLQTRDVLASGAGDLAVELGSYKLSAQDPAGNPIDDAGKYMAVFRRVDGGWKIVADTWNSDRPLPGEEGAATGQGQ